jgi:hypothetical protein
VQLGKVIADMIARMEATVPWLNLEDHEIYAALAKAEEELRSPRPQRTFLLMALMLAECRPDLREQAAAAKLLLS